MFGFLSPRPHPFAYRRLYARLCQHQRRWYGIASLAFHSYEAVFAYQLAADAGAVPDGVLPNRRCCRLVRPTNLGAAADAAVGKYASSVGVLLAGVKLDDDIRDGKSLAARAVKFVLGGAIRRAGEHLAKLDPKFPAAIRYYIAEHHELERRGGVIPLAEYAVPTGEAFAVTYRLLGRLPGLAQHTDTFATVGRHVGKAILASDAAVDWERDRRRNEYNPLPDASAVADATRFAADELTDAAAVCRSAFGATAGSEKTLIAVRDRIMRPAAVACPAPSWGKTLTGLAVATFVPRRTLVAAKGDLPEALGGLPTPDEPLPGQPENPSSESRKTACHNIGDACGVGCDCGSNWACDPCGNACDSCNCDGCSGCDCNCN